MSATEDCDLHQVPFHDMKNIYHIQIYLITFEADGPLFLVI